MDIEKSRHNMIEHQIRPCNILNERLLDALASVKREMFVTPDCRSIAFIDMELNLPGGGKMLRPALDAALIQYLAVTSSCKVLEVGTGSGYVTSILSRLASFVYSAEINEENRKFAVQNIAYAGANNVSVVSGDGLKGLAKFAPYDRIYVGGAVDSIPHDLVKQLAYGGLMVCIIGSPPAMHAVLIEKVGEDNFKETKLFETATEYLVGADNLNKFVF